jgi:hypothetical protein
MYTNLHLIVLTRVETQFRPNRDLNGGLEGQ